MQREPREPREDRPALPKPPVREWLPAAQERGAPASGGKSAEDLRSILRTMTAKTSVDTARKETQNQRSLKAALTDALAKGPPARPVTERPNVPRPAPAQPARVESQQAPRREEQREPLAMPVPKQAAASQAKPFEVPEDELRRVLKGET